MSDETIKDLVIIGMLIAWAFCMKYWRDGAISWVGALWWTLVVVVGIVLLEHRYGVP